MNSLEKLNPCIRTVLLNFGEGVVSSFPLLRKTSRKGRYMGCRKASSKSKPVSSLPQTCKILR